MNSGIKPILFLALLFHPGRGEKKQLVEIMLAISYSQKETNVPVQSQ